MPRTRKCAVICAAPPGEVYTSRWVKTLLPRKMYYTKTITNTFLYYLRMFYSLSQGSRLPRNAENFAYISPSLANSWKIKKALCFQQYGQKCNCILYRLQKLQSTVGTVHKSLLGVGGSVKNLHTPPVLARFPKSLLWDWCMRSIRTQWNTCGS